MVTFLSQNFGGTNKVVKSKAICQLKNLIKYKKVCYS